MTATSSVEILQKLIKNPPEEKEDEAVAAEILVNDFYSFQDTLLNIHALSLFVQGLDREEVLRHISNKSWIEQHEILTRWAWMTSQKEEIQKGTPFNSPYLCKVDRKVGRKTLDREFYTFRLFLPGYCKDTKTEYLFSEKLQSSNDPPDFVAVDKQNNKIGIEITEAPLNEGSSYQEKQGEIVRQKLEEDFPRLNCIIGTVDGNDQPDWAELLKNYEELSRWVGKISGLDKSKIFHHPHLKIRVRVSILKCSIEIPIGHRSAGNRDEHKASKAICKAIARKVEKNSTPKIKPCILVIYENTDLKIIDKKLVVDLVSENLEAQWQNLYEGVWLVIRGCVFKICE
ncbi:MAG: hypothetical protein OXG87_12145 [Gemmatimonadetes bacterium]|nr:hypothetical protein [Gemmatimonadota bacterium]